MPLPLSQIGGVDLDFVRVSLDGSQHKTNHIGSHMPLHD